MSRDYEYYTKFGWDSNPFTLTISPKLMVGYSNQINSLLSHTFNLHKFALVIGPTGSGKTTMLLWLRSQLMAYKKFLPFYISKPPRSMRNLIFLFRSLLGFSFLDKIRFGNLSPFNITKFLKVKLKNRQLVLLVDEAHECSLTNLEWFRTITDSLRNLSIIFAGLPTFEKMIETKLPTLFMRITTKAYLNTLSKSETSSLISKRIENVGGEGIKPFTTDAIDRIFEITGGFPREVIKVCDKLIKESAEKNIFTIDRNFIDQVVTISETPKTVELRVSLSKKQKKILQLLNENPNLTPSEMVEHLGSSDYKNKNNAIRSINNILRRLIRDEFVQRKKFGNSYVYSLSGKAKTLLAEA